MVSMNSSPPVAMPVQVPPGHVLQQIIDENGAVRTVLLPTPPPHHMAPHHAHHMMHTGNFVPGNMSAQQQYYHASQMGYAPVTGPHFHHPPMPPAGGGHYPAPQPPPHTMAQCSPPQSPSASGYTHKDERTQKQYVKLKRKLVQKQMREGPPEEFINGVMRNNDAASPQADGESSTSSKDQEEEESNTMEDMLSAISGPNVEEITARSALLLWSGPAVEPYQNYPIIYDVLLGDTRLGKEGRYKSIYSGTSQSCRIEDLRPGQQYKVCLQARLNGHTGAPSEPAVFTTSACEPDAPAVPKLISRSRTSLQLRWSTTNDNGLPISHYLLEYDKGLGGGENFVELTKSKGKQTTVTKLDPNRCYMFRLAAVNGCGRSQYSDVAVYKTAGYPPPQPAAPSLHAATPSSLHIKWTRQSQDEEYTVQMEDPTTKHGFLVVYSGQDTELLRRDLNRNSEYKFRLQALNQEGRSPWSETTVFRTLPDKPDAPGKPYVKGKMHAYSFKAKWDAPADKGGSVVHSYRLVLAEEHADFAVVYSGPDTEAVCDRLQPGTSYRLRVSCEGPGGHSPLSDVAVVTTEPVCPGRCAAPVSGMRPEATVVGIRWERPSYDGGAPVLEYDVELTTPDDEKRLAFRGPDTECKIGELTPGSEYAFAVRAVNRVGAGAWSDRLSLCSGPAPPCVPDAPDLAICSPIHVSVTWSEPNCYGSPVTAYRLEMSSTGGEDAYSVVYTGPNRHHDARNLTPFTSYYFRLSAANVAGASPCSIASATFTPAAAPGPVGALVCEATPDQIVVNWKTPASNGADITHYNVEYADRIVKTDDDATRVVLENLSPETQYRIRAQAVNDVGSGPFSPTVKISTPPLPPAPPTLEVVGSGHNYLKLKWGDGRNTNFTQFHLEMYNQRAREYQCIYQGMEYVCKVNKLQEQTAYTFRICASNDEAGQGRFSDEVAFTTGIAPPAGLKAAKLVELTCNTCSIEWSPCKQNHDNLVYAVQCSNTRDREFKQVHRGTVTKYTFNDLEPDSEYHVRVVPIRIIENNGGGGELAGAASPLLVFNTPRAGSGSDDEDRAPGETSSGAGGGLSAVRERRSPSMKTGAPRSAEHKKPLTDQQWAGIIIFALFVFALAAAIITEAYINWHKSA